MHPDFINAPISWAFAAYMATNAPTSTTPVAWTRGLQSDGTWAPDSPWRGEGGHITFIDGHVEWVEDTEDYFKDYQTGEAVTDIRKALPPGAKILEWEPRQ